MGTDDFGDKNKSVLYVLPFWQIKSDLTTHKVA